MNEKKKNIESKLKNLSKVGTTNITNIVEILKLIMYN